MYRIINHKKLLMLLETCFFYYRSGEDNSWRIQRNYLSLLKNFLEIDYPTYRVSENQRIEFQEEVKKIIKRLEI